MRACGAHCSVSTVSNGLACASGFTSVGCATIPKRTVCARSASICLPSDAIRSSSSSAACCCARRSASRRACATRRAAASSMSGRNASVNGSR
ncbi:hypothetical protein DO71_6111 [Burkholderia pseudomallei]|nr:hypothetical protein DO71_6111 [Burkholderia pseudomallei]